jgi:hypothetical protein
MIKVNANQTGTYKVGYGRPPKKHQFKKGQSGNPTGLRHAKKSLYEEIIAELQSEKIVVIEGKSKKFTKQAILVKNAVSHASSGKIQLLKLLVEAAPKMEQMNKQHINDHAEALQDNPLLKKFKELAKKYNTRG